MLARRTGRCFGSAILALVVLGLCSSGRAQKFKPPAERQAGFSAILEGVPMAHPEAVRRDLGKYNLTLPSSNIRVVPPDMQPRVLGALRSKPLLGMRVDSSGHPYVIVSDGRGEALEFDSVQNIAINYRPFRDRVIHRPGILLLWEIPHELAAARLGEMKLDAQQRRGDCGLSPLCTIYANQMFGWTRGLAEHLGAHDDPHSPFSGMPKDDPGLSSYETDNPMLVGAPRVLLHMKSPDAILALPTDRALHGHGEHTRTENEWQVWKDFADSLGGWQKDGTVHPSFPVAIPERRRGWPQ